MKQIIASEYESNYSFAMKQIIALVMKQIIASVETNYSFGETNYSFGVCNKL